MPVDSVKSVLFGDRALLAAPPRQLQALPGLAVLLLAVCCLPATAQAIDVRQAHWGFDGQVVPQRFNMISVLIDNSAANAFEGTLTLRKVAGGKQVDAKIVEPLYLSPYSSRWVQFYPYIKSDQDQWEISWGSKAATSFTLSNVRAGKPAVILLDDPDAIPQSAGAIRRLADNLFPPYVTATDGLAAIILDHVPRWDPARQKSFLEWLKRGGRVYVLQSSEGKFPEFAGELQVLSTAVEKRRVGSGHVYHVERTRRMLDQHFIEDVIGARIDPGRNAASEAGLTDPVRPADPPGAASATLASYGIFNVNWDPEEKLLTDLKKMSLPEHNWLLIHLLAWIYLWLIFPGSLTLGRKHGGDFRVTFGFLLGTVVVFSLAFLFVGRRGYNEATVLNSVAIARQQVPGFFDVTQWSNGFAVEGGDYLFTHAGTGRIYSSCQDQEMVRDEIQNGPEAHFLADLPPYSSWVFSHRGVFELQAIDVEVEDWLTIQDSNPPKVTVRNSAKAAIVHDDRALGKLKLKKGKRFPDEYLELCVLYGRRVYSLNVTADHIELGREVGTLATLIRVADYHEDGSMFNSFKMRSNEIQSRGPPTQTEMFHSEFYPLLARNLDLTDQLEVEQFALASDRARLLIYAPMPPGLHTQEARFTRQNGYVLYIVDVYEPES